jgi:hypothetical protein
MLKCYCLQVIISYIQPLCKDWRYHLLSMGKFLSSVVCPANTSSFGQCKWAPSFEHLKKNWQVADQTKTLKRRKSGFFWKALTNQTPFQNPGNTYDTGILVMVKYHIDQPTRPFSQVSAICQELGTEWLLPMISECSSLVIARLNDAFYHRTDLHFQKVFRDKTPDWSDWNISFLKEPFGPY